VKIKDVNDMSSNFNTQSDLNENGV
jgi:hypothetical protein